MIKRDLRKYLFTERIVDLWNSMPVCVVKSSHVNSFKRKLDKRWCDQDIRCNQEVCDSYKATVTGTEKQVL